MRYGNSGRLLSVPRVPQFGPGWDAVLVFWILAAVALTWILFRSNWGLVVRATGEYPPAVVASGYSPLKMRLQAVLAGGALAGLAGAYLALGVAGSFTENTTAGRGFVALAMVTFGRWKPVWVFFASLMIGYADSLQFELQARGIGLPPQVFIALPYVLALAVLVVVGKGTSVPAALAKPYRAED
jgi:simple sugar transport system permease protein